MAVTFIEVDGIAYYRSDVQRLVHERHSLAGELSHARTEATRLRSLLRLRTEALGRVVADLAIARAKVN